MRTKKDIKAESESYQRVSTLVNLIHLIPALIVCVGMKTFEVNDSGFFVTLVVAAALLFFMNGLSKTAFSKIEKLKIESNCRL